MALPEVGHFLTHGFGWFSSEHYLVTREPVAPAQGSATVRIHGEDFDAALLDLSGKALSDPVRAYDQNLKTAVQEQIENAGVDKLA